MDISKLKEISEIFQEKGLTKLEIFEGDFKIILEKQPSHSQVSSVNLVSPIETVLPTSTISNEKDFEVGDFKEVKSPMVGVFYSAPSPEAGPFVTVGTKVKKGDVLCIIEAMKLMNEITAEMDGEIVDICVPNGQVVEYSQTLFKMI